MITLAKDRLPGKPRYYWSWRAHCWCALEYHGFGRQGWPQYLL